MTSDDGSLPILAGQHGREAREVPEPKEQLPDGRCSLWRSPETHLTSVSAGQKVNCSGGRTRTCNRLLNSKTRPSAVPTNIAAGRARPSLVKGDGHSTARCQRQSKRIQFVLDAT
jgi:hypothetical protein